MISFIAFINILLSPGLSVTSNVKISEDDVGAITLAFLQFLKDWVYTTFTADIVK